MIQFSHLQHSELPFRVQINSLSGAGDTPAGAIMAALSAGDKIPRGERDRMAAARYLFWNYEPSQDWVALIAALEKNQFPSGTETREEP